MSRRYSLVIYLVVWIPLIILLLIGMLTTALKSAFGVTFGWLSAGLFRGGYCRPASFRSGGDDVPIWSNKGFVKLEFWVP